MTRSLLLCAVVAAASIAQADWVIGSGRYPGMGNAGLALPRDFLYSGRLNPGLYGLAPAKFQFQVPRFSFRVHRVSLRDLQDFSGAINRGGLSGDDIGELARKLGDDEFEFGAGAGLGFLTHGFALDVNGDALVAGFPNDPLRAWVQGGATGVVPIDARLDAYGIAGYEIGLGYGRRLNNPGNTDISVGARLKIVRGYYTHRIADASAIQGGGNGFLAPEMGGRDTLNESGVGLDIGVVASASPDQGFFYGATVENLVVPRTSFNVTNPGGSGTGGVRPYERKFNVGFGYLAPNQAAFAADFVDVFNGSGQQELRVGSELLFGGIAVRGGYESRSGFTLGVGFGGFNLAFVGNSSKQMSYAFRF